MTKDGRAIEREVTDIITLEPNGGTLVVVGSVFIPQDAVPRFAALPPISSMLGSKTNQRVSDKRAKKRHKRAERATLLKQVDEGDDKFAATNGNIQRSRTLSPEASSRANPFEAEG